MNKFVFPVACCLIISVVAGPNDLPDTACLARPLMGDAWCDGIKGSNAQNISQLQQACKYNADSVNGNWCLARCSGPMALNRGADAIKTGTESTPYNQSYTWQGSTYSADWRQPQNAAGNLCVRWWETDSWKDGGSPSFDQTVAVQDYLNQQPCNTCSTCGSGWCCSTCNVKAYAADDTNNPTWSCGNHGFASCANGEYDGATDTFTCHNCQVPPPTPVPSDIGAYIMSQCQARNGDNNIWPLCTYAFTRPVVAGQKLSDFYWGTCAAKKQSDDDCADSWLAQVWPSKKPASNSGSVLDRCLNAKFPDNAPVALDSIGGFAGCVDACMDLSDQADIDACVGNFKVFWSNVWNSGAQYQNNAPAYALWKTRGQCVDKDDGTVGGGKDFWTCVERSMGNPASLPWPNAANGWVGGSNIKNILDNSLKTQLLYPTWAGFIVSLEQLRWLFNELLTSDNTLSNFLQEPMCLEAPTCSGGSNPTCADSSLTAQCISSKLVTPTCDDGSTLTCSDNSLTPACSTCPEPCARILKNIVDSLNNGQVQLEDGTTIDLTLLPTTTANSSDLFKAVAQKHIYLATALNEIISCVNKSGFGYLPSGEKPSTTGIFDLSALAGDMAAVKNILIDWTSAGTSSTIKNYQGAITDIEKDIWNALNEIITHWLKAVPTAYKTDAINHGQENLSGQVNYKNWPGISVEGFLGR